MRGTAKHKAHEACRELGHAYTGRAAIKFCSEFDEELKTPVNLRLIRTHDVVHRVVEVFQHSHDDLQKRRKTTEMRKSG